MIVPGLTEYAAQSNDRADEKTKTFLSFVFWSRNAGLCVGQHAVIQRNDRKRFNLGPRLETDQGERQRERGGDRGRETERERGGDRGKVRYKRKKLEFGNKQLVGLYPIRLLHLGAIILKRNLLSAVQGN